MRGFWKKKLPAFLLAMTMAVSLATPAAMALPDHNYNYSKWVTDAENHWHKCSDSGCDAMTDYEPHDFGGIKVVTEDIRAKAVRHTNSCFFTMVAVDDQGKPTPVPPLEPETHDQKRRFFQAQQRRQIRRELVQRYKEMKEVDFDSASQS